MSVRTQVQIFQFHRIHLLWCFKIVIPDENTIQYENSELATKLTEKLGKLNGNKDIKGKAENILRNVKRKDANFNG